MSQSIIRTYRFPLKTNRKQNNHPWKLDPFEKSDVVTRYCNGQSAQKIGLFYGVTNVAVLGILHRRSVAVRSQAQAEMRHKYQHDAFDVHSPKSDYWCGFLFADGTIVRRTGSPELALVLSEKDRDHVFLFREFLHSSHAITFVKNVGTTFGTHSAVRYSIRSSELVHALEMLGMKRKSLDRVAVDALCASPDFWRGVIDGDGWVGLSKGRPRLELVGGHALLVQFLAYLQSHRIALGVRVLPHKSIFRVSLCGGSALSAISLLYRDSSVALHRKKNAALNILALGRSAVGSNAAEAL